MSFTIRPVTEEIVVKKGFVVIDDRGVAVGVSPEAESAQDLATVLSRKKAKASLIAAAIRVLGRPVSLDEVEAAQSEHVIHSDEVLRQIVSEADEKLAAAKQILTTQQRLHDSAHIALALRAFEVSTALIVPPPAQETQEDESSSPVPGD